MTDGVIDGDSTFGHMRDTVVVPPDIDLAAPIAPDFDTADGILHR